MFSHSHKEACSGGGVELRLDTLVIHSRLTAQRLHSDGMGYRGSKRTILAGALVRSMLTQLSNGATLSEVLPAKIPALIGQCTGCEGKPDHVACTLRLASSKYRKKF